MRIYVEQFEPKWKKSRHLTIIETDNFNKIIPDKTGENTPRILIIKRKKKLQRYDIDRIRYLWDEEYQTLEMILIVSKTDVRVP